VCIYGYGQPYVYGVHIRFWPTLNVEYRLLLIVLCEGV